MKHYVSNSLSHSSAILKVNHFLIKKPKACSCGHNHSALPLAHSFRTRSESIMNGDSFWFQCQSKSCNSTLTINVDKCVEKSNGGVPMNRQHVDCGHCTGHGMGIWNGSRCTYCNGKGYFELDDDEWDEYCEEHGLDPETGEEHEPKT